MKGFVERLDSLMNLLLILSLVLVLLPEQLPSPLKFALQAQTDAENLLGVINKLKSNSSIDPKIVEPK